MQFKGAGFWCRSIAFVLDLFILNILFLFLILGGTWAVGMGLTAISLDSPSTELIRFMVDLYVWVWLMLFLGYFFLFMACGGQTPAKRILRLKVLRKDDQAVNWKSALLRTLGYFLSGPLLLGLGFLLIVVHPRKMALHDLIAGTTVIHDPS